MEYFDLVTKLSVGMQAVAFVLLVSGCFVKGCMWGLNTFKGRLALWSMIVVGASLCLAFVTYNDMPAVSHSIGIIAAILGCYTGMAFTMIYIVLWGSIEYKSPERDVANSYAELTILSSAGYFILYIAP